MSSQDVEDICAALLASDEVEEVDDLENNPVWMPDTSGEYGSISPPRRVEILRAGGKYFKPGQFAYVLSYDKRGSNYWVDKDGASREGELAYLVSKTKDMRGGALWFSADGLRFTGSK
jgi:hypothetical protein